GNHVVLLDQSNILSGYMVSQLPGKVKESVKGRKNYRNSEIMGTFRPFGSFISYETELTEGKDERDLFQSGAGVTGNGRRTDDSG
ncbi:MAG: hypothetical protein IKI93_05965, partial [Clostridia bacterium]|nr:hypothetical protein [Clostridia bacterium]